MRAFEWSVTRFVSLVVNPISKWHLVRNNEFPTQRPSFRDSVSVRADSKGNRESRSRHLCLPKALAADSDWSRRDQPAFRTRIGVFLAVSSFEPQFLALLPSDQSSIASTVRGTPRDSAGK